MGPKPNAAAAAEASTKVGHRKEKAREKVEEEEEDYGGAAASVAVGAVKVPIYGSFGLGSGLSQFPKRCVGVLLLVFSVAWRIQHRTPNREKG